MTRTKLHLPEYAKRIIRIVSELGKWFKVSIKNVLKLIHFKTTKKAHIHLLGRFRIYARWWGWQYHHHVHASLGVIAVFVMGLTFYNSMQSAQASSVVIVEGHATSQNTGLNIEFGSNHDATVTIDNWTRQMSGHAWSDDIGWIDFGGGVDNPNGPVTANKNGILSGRAKVINSNSYIDFRSSVGANVGISNGSFTGHAWSDDLGWIDFGAVSAPDYDPDLIVPVNASNLLLSKGSGGVSIASNAWINSYPYAAWTAATDDPTGSGIKGYCLYLGHDPTGDPVTTKGYLGASPLSTDGACQFAVADTSIDLAAQNIIGSALTTSNTPYYLNIVAIDNSFNVYNAGSPAQFIFRYDTTLPTNPAFVTAPSQFVSNKSINLTWNTVGGSASFDANSGIAGLQYKIGNNGTWYGDNHSGSQDFSDLLDDDGTYTTQDNPDYANLNEGNNMIYFRTWDIAGNVSEAYVNTVIKINTSSPSPPQNLSATPSVNVVNSFAFSWLPPASYQGVVSNITYCYTINALPTNTNCTYTEPGVTSLDAGAYATIPGNNTIYVVAKDEAGNINYATHASATFTANTPAPGIPLNLDVADVSIKATSNWKLALSWDIPSTTGAGIATYAVYRSTDGNSFTKIANTAGSSYVDSGLSQQKYYYKLRACDSANNCGAFTDVVNLIPTGKFTSPANMLVQPKSSVETRSATISWTTDRESNSSIQYGTSSNDYFPTQASKSDQVVSHSVRLDNLFAGTTYYYRTLWTDGDGNTGRSAEYSFTTLPAPAIKNATVTGLNLHEATISFTSTGATGIKLYYGPNGNMTSVKELNTSTNESSYTIPLTGLIDGTSYTYSLNPIDTGGFEYKNTESHSFNTPPAPAITNVRFEPVPGSLTGTEKITWTTNVPATSHISYSLQDKPLSAGLEMVNSELKTEHSMIITDLEFDTPFQVVASSQDRLGNTAASDLQVFRTGLDTRPPTISNVVIQSSIRGTGISAAGQIIVSWKTDKPSTSQVAYGVGSGGDFTSRTSEDAALVTSHTVVISNLPTSQVFHLQAISKDKAGNTGTSPNRTTIVGQATDSAIGIVFNALRGIFGL